MKEKEIFDYLIHEIKNSSQSIVLSAGIMKKLMTRDEFPKESVLKLVSRLGEQAEALYDQVRDAGLYFREENFPLTFDLHALINDIIDEYKPFMTSGNTNIQTEYDLTIRNVIQDEFKVRTIIVNLLKNSIEASKRSGTIKLSTSVAGGAVSVIVENNGPVIPEELIKKIFEPMFTTKKTGTGLGLAIVSRFAKNIQGSVKVNSSDTRTYFILTFPGSLK
ncbi:HAMP domain-containing histidine kinase [bacterium]|nr:HAMP domain-containing histidine kinase [bacterium]